MSPSRSVAIFDLDHGILTEPAADVVEKRLIAPNRDSRRLFRRLATAVGSYLPAQAISPLLGGSIRGARVDAVRAAGRAAADELALAPHAQVVLDEHRRAGRRLVATTQAPLDAALPIADTLGFDDVIATRYSHDDRELEGNIEGSLVWGRGKLDAVRDWAGHHDASLRRSYFYSGAFADAPVLAEVGRPVVTDPDPRLAPLAWLKGWPTRSLRTPAGVPRVLGVELQQLLRPFARPELVTNARIELHDLEYIPSDGPAIVCGNHRSYFDAMAVGLAITRRGRTARFLGKKEVFDAPLVGAVARWAGGIRVDRGTGSDEPLRAAAEALEAGELICLMPQGTIPRGPAFFEPELRGRWGAARLAAMTRAPVIPVGLWGTEQVWPRNSRLPNLNPLRRPLVTLRAGPPVALRYEDPDADTRAIMSAISSLLPDEARERREPTPEELARTYPAGYKGDPGRESDRRPGTDT